MENAYLFDVYTDSKITRDANAGEIVVHGQIRKSAGDGVTNIQVPVTVDNGNMIVDVGTLSIIEKLENALREVRE